MSKTAYFVRTTESRQAIIRLSGGVETEIFAHGDTQNWQVHMAAVDGRWLAFTLISTGGWNDFKLLLWDAQSGDKPRVVAEATRSPTGEAVPGPVIAPTFGGGALYWAQVQADGETSVLEALSLSDGTVTGYPARRGAGTPVIFGDLVVWREYGPNGPVSSVVARELTTGKEVPAPPTLKSAFSNYVASDGSTMIWTTPSGDNIMIHYARTDGKAGRIEIPGSSVSSLSVSGDMVVLLTDERTWIGNLVSGQYVAATAQWGFGSIDSGVIVVSDPPGKETGRTSWMIRIADTPALPPCK